MQTGLSHHGDPMKGTGKLLRLVEGPPKYNLLAKIEGRSCETPPNKPRTRRFHTQQ
jgi:hypothetical protein